MSPYSVAVTAIAVVLVLNPAFSALAQSGNLRASQGTDPEPSLRFVETANLPPLPAHAATKVPFPMPVTGSCAAGTPYQINSVWDLYANKGELECIFAAGKPISAVPLGHSYGYLIAALNTAAFGIIPEVLYQGDFSVKTVCSGQFTTLGFMSIGGVKPGSAVWTNDDPAKYIPKLAPGEAPLPDSSLVMDFLADVDALCGADGNVNPALLVNFNPFSNSLFPVKLFVDIGVVVGRDVKDGGLIMLNKAYIIPEGEYASLGAMTVLMYAIKNFDPAVSPDFKAHTTIYVPNSFEYSRGGLESFMKRMDMSQIVPDVPQALNPWVTTFTGKHPAEIEAMKQMAVSSATDMMHPSTLTNPTSIQKAAEMMGTVMMGPFQNMLTGQFNLLGMNALASMLPFSVTDFGGLPALGGESFPLDFLRNPSLGNADLSGLDFLNTLAPQDISGLDFINNLESQEFGMNFMDALLESGADVTRFSDVVNSLGAPPATYEELEATFTNGGVSLEQVSEAMQSLSQQEYRNWRSRMIDQKSDQPDRGILGGSVFTQGLQALGSVFGS